MCFVDNLSSWFSCRCSDDFCRRNVVGKLSMPIRHPLDVVHDAAISDLLKRIPPSLYKYSGLSGERIEWMRRLLVDSKLYFPPPSAFNDPLDSRIPPRYDASRLSIEQFWRGVVRRNYPKDKMRSHKGRIQKMVMDSRTREGQERFTEQLFESLDKHGIACFAKDPTNMLVGSFAKQAIPCLSRLSNNCSVKRS